MNTTPAFGDPNGFAGRADLDALTAVEHDIDEANVADAGPFLDPEYGETEFDDAIEPERERSWAELWPHALLVAAVVGWTALFLFANRGVAGSGFTPGAIVDLVVGWSVPVALLCLVYLLVIRSSAREARRFGNISANLRGEAEALEDCLRSANAELASARQSLAEEANALENLGAQSTARLSGSAETLRNALSVGLADMQALNSVSQSANQNLGQLQEHLPVVVNTAKDVTNQIGNIGRSAQTEVAGMVSALKRAGQVGGAASDQLVALQSESAATLDRLEQAADRAEAAWSTRIAELESRTAEMAETLDNRATSSAAHVSDLASELTTAAQASSSELSAALSDMQRAISAVEERSREQTATLHMSAGELEEQLTAAAEQLRQLQSDGGENAAQLAFALTALQQNGETLRHEMASGADVTDTMIARAEELHRQLEGARNEVTASLPQALEQLDARGASSLAELRTLADVATDLDTTGVSLNASLDRAGEKLVERRGELTLLRDDMGSVEQDLTSGLAQLNAAIQSLRADSEALAEETAGRFTDMSVAANEIATSAREAIRSALADASVELQKQNDDDFMAAVEQRMSGVTARLEQSVQASMGSATDGVDHLAEKLSEIDAASQNLETRIEFMREQAASAAQPDFARQVALLTESLNSTAIDVTKILSNDVADTDWATYLKGDRGIFTRRAVQLLDNGQARDILSAYETDGEFRAHVNRYIHDFEAMLRGVLSGRDGSAVGVTLLSSDIGKLYVALAQAIERLR